MALILQNHKEALLKQFYWFPFSSSESSGLKWSQRPYNCNKFSNYNENEDAGKRPHFGKHYTTEIQNKAKDIGKDLMKTAFLTTIQDKDKDGSQWAKTSRKGEQ